MPVTIQPATLKYKNDQGVFQSADCIKGDPGIPGDPTELIDDTAGDGDTNKTWSADKLTDLNTAISGKYEKPSGGIPATDLASGVIPSVPVTDVQVNGTSVLSNGVANVPMASSSAPGAVIVTDYTYGLSMRADGNVRVYSANANQVKAGTEEYRPIVPLRQDASTFYGLAKAAGDSTQASSSNSVGTYTETAKSKISDMLNAPVSVIGSTPSITAKSGIRYVCGEVATLTIVVPASGIIDVTFESGSTPTVLTVTPPTGVTIKYPAWFNPSSLAANTTYEINIADGKNAVVMAWA